MLQAVSAIIIIIIILGFIAMHSISCCLTHLVLSV